MGRNIIPEVGVDGFRRYDHQCRNPKLLFRYSSDLTGTLEIKCPGCREVITVDFNRVPEDLG